MPQPRLSLIFCLILIAASHVLAADASADASVKPGNILWANPLDSATDLAGSDGEGTLVTQPGRANVLQISRTVTKDSALRSFALPAEKLRGKWIYLSADVKASDVSPKPQDWNGIKVMLKLETATETRWPQIAIPVGSFDFVRLSTRILVPPDTTSATLILGLEKVSGAVWFDNLRISVAKSGDTAAAPAPPVPADQPIFKGHHLPALRGAMVHPRMTEDDLRVFARDWGANLIRWQLLYLPKPGTQTDLNAYDLWLDGELARLDQVLGWARQLGVLVVVDLHSPPGGAVGGGGTVNASGAFWTNPAAQTHFINVWQRITQRYKGNPTIWGFDLVNEPDDKSVIEGCDDWQALSERAAKAIRSLDPQRTLIVEPPDWGGAAGFVGFEPLPLPNIVYSFHMYSPMEFTHQGVIGPGETVPYPGRAEGKMWDKSALEASMAPAIEFARKYRVHLYVGEFSAIRWAPGAERYLADLIDLFEAHGWDWTYHAYREWQGWSLELGTDKADTHPTTVPSQRQQLIRKWLRQNRPANSQVLPEIGHFRLCGPLEIPQGHGHGRGVVAGLESHLIIIEQRLIHQRGHPVDFSDRGFGPDLAIREDLTHPVLVDQCHLVSMQLLPQAL